jgi:hypothetical protein
MGQENYSYCMFIGSPMGFNHQHKTDVDWQTIHLKEGITDQKLNLFHRGYF